MLLHKKRLQGNLNGIGYVNPYACERLENYYIHPLTYNGYKDNLILKDKQKITEAEKKANEEFRMLSGSGVMDVVNTVEQVYSGIKNIGKFYSSRPGTFMTNMWGKYVNPHPNWRPNYVGENHMIIDNTTSNFLGPGTHIEERIKRGDPPLDGINGIDAQARIHDIDYMKAKTLDDVRKADIKLLKNIDQSTGKPYLKKLTKTAIKSKMLAEDLGILDKNKFAQIDLFTNKDTKMVGQGMKKSKNKLKKVRAMGKYPDSYIRNKLLKEYKSSSKKLQGKISK